MFDKIETQGTISAPRNSMSGPVVFLALLSCFQVVIAEETKPKCDYKTGLLEPYLAASANLYCFDDQGASHSP
jgi:hypothetical protein